ncbi:MAG TPA: hypothetical protein VHA14_02315 [Bryobacteraceae bacterium]|nr:hypothetical protein [Bryobacteraceae bacterium]
MKLKLPAAHPEESGLESDSAEVDDTSAEDISFKTRMAAKDQNQKSESQDRDW